MNFVAKDVVKLFLEKRGFSTEDYPQLISEDLSIYHDGLLLKDAELFIDKLKEVFDKDLKIGFVPDYDGDGIMSGVIGCAGLSALGFWNIVMYEPRCDTGYGLSVAVIDELLESHPDIGVILTADNGISAFDAVEYAKKRGLMVLISDHHTGKDIEPCADVIVNPNRVGDTYPFNGLSGAMVLWKLLLAYAQKYDDSAMHAIFSLGVFAGISAISDVMPILDENRLLVKHTMRLLKDANALVKLSAVDGIYGRVFKGLQSLIAVLFDNGKLKYEFDEQTIGFYIAPMLNAPRRMLGTSTEAFDLFLNMLDGDEPKDYAERLFAINEERKARSNQMWENVKEQAGEDGVFILDTLPGLVGLMAGQTTNNFGIPSIVFCVEGDGDSIVNADGLGVSSIGGSARSPEWFDMYDFLRICDEIYPEMFLGWGGHKQAAGLTINMEYYDRFIECYKQAVAVKLTELESVEVESPYITVSDRVGDDFDFVVDAGSIKMQIDELMSLFKTLKPFGQGFRKPEFSLDFDFNKSDDKYFLIGAENQHVKIELKKLGLVVIVWNNGADFVKMVNSVEGSNLRFKAIGEFGVNIFRSRETIQFTGNTLACEGYVA